MYNNTGSVLLAMVLHSMANTADISIPLAAAESIIDGVVDERAVGIVVVVHLAVYGLIVLAVVAYNGRETRSDGSVPTAADVGD